MASKEFLHHCLKEGETQLQMVNHIKTVRLLDVGTTGVIVEATDHKNRRHIHIAPMSEIQNVYVQIEGTQ